MDTTHSVLTINYTWQYINEIVPSLTQEESERVVKWLGDTFDEYMGINRETIIKTAQGVQSGLL